jgi:hypothetical protein
VDRFTAEQQERDKNDGTYLRLVATARCFHDVHHIRSTPSYLVIIVISSSSSFICIRLGCCIFLSFKRHVCCSFIRTYTSFLPFRSQPFLPP